MMIVQLPWIWWWWLVLEKIFVSAAFFSLALLFVVWPSWQVVAGQVPVEVLSAVQQEAALTVVPILVAAPLPAVSTLLVFVFVLLRLPLVVLANAVLQVLLLVL